MTEQKIDKYTAKINQEFLENKIKMIPSSVKETYSDLVSQNPILVSRELVVNGQVTLGVEYAPNGDPVCTYTTDNKGNHINIEKVDNSTNLYENNTLKDLISERLQAIADIKENKATAKAKVSDVKEVARPKKVSKAPTRIQRARS